LAKINLWRIFAAAKQYTKPNNMKNLTYLLPLFLLVSCQNDPIEINENIEPAVLNYQSAEIDDFITSKIQKGQVFDWSSASDEMVHSAAMLSDEIVAIGYQPLGAEKDEDVIGTFDKLPKEWLDERDNIVDAILSEERRMAGDPNLSLADILPFGLDDEIPTIAIKTTSLKTIKAFRSQETIRYMEPMGYEYTAQAAAKSLGCGSAPNYNISPYDYTTSYGSKIPWNFSNHNIQSAWSYSQGDNIGICIIDTGSSDSQDNLRSNFASYRSGGRSIGAYSTKYSGSWWWKSKDSPNDPCGHGTSMSGLAAAPWSGDGNAVGVAYKADLITVRAVEDVLISSSNEKNGVKDALKLAGNRSGTKIISMSIGNIISSGTVKDGVYYAYNRGKLIFAAAGTSTSFTNWAGVIFPASMSQCVAVTGVKAKSSYERCNTCHSGSAVEFTIQMQRSWDTDRNSLSLARSGNQPDYISGSSCATATTAGIAALVWARNPSMSKWSVLSRMRKASQNYPYKNGSYGYGNINAKAAVLNHNY